SSRCAIVTALSICRRINRELLYGPQVSGRSRMAKLVCLAKRECFGGRLERVGKRLIIGRAASGTRRRLSKAQVAQTDAVKVSKLPILSMVSGGQFKEV
ncbi:hypothetical protein LTR28_002268, partial [Elasticomyces elasticus]